ncbi:collagen alpha-2(I) chain-like [Pseudopipra pipra]|uniref:collagen alpha-2(I) chain-like n=1 Tax=Pseudopipra pipra TaxID=415032 RepID=UPI00313A309C
MPRGKAELRGSLGVDPPVSRVRVWEPLRSLSWQPVRGDRPVSGERVRWPPKRREGASAGLWAQGPPVSRGQCPGVPGALWSGQRPEAPVSRAAASLAAASRAQLPLPRGPGSPQPGWDCAVRRREAVGEESGRGVARDGSAGAGRRRGALPEESRAVERDGEARARKKSVGFALKRGRERGPLGKGPSLASPGQGSLRVRRAACGCAGRLGAGRPPCKQGRVLCFAWRWPFAIALLWLPGERGNRPVRRARVPASAPEGGNGALPTPGPPAL